ncbi:MAG: RsmD family RNA methyltransferase [Thermomicrobiales bacterium]
MRVVAGIARGAKLKAPAGMRTRPMADKIKEALFSVLMSLGVEPQRVLDLYAGSGAVGIEALSRSAEWADFVEQRADACAVIRENLAHTKFDQISAVHQTSVESFLARTPAEPYDFVIMDPHYADLQIGANLERLAHSALVAPGTIIVLGHSPRVILPLGLPGLRQLRQRCHGDSCFAVYEVTEQPS